MERESTEKTTLLIRASGFVPQIVGNGTYFSIDTTKPLLAGEFRQPLIRATYAVFGPIDGVYKEQQAKVFAMVFDNKAACIHPRAAFVWTAIAPDLPEREKLGDSIDLVVDENGGTTVRLRIYSGKAEKTRHDLLSRYA